ncbi:hypothetical protein [Umezawaea sp. NPDC059074]|uniref:SecDF P1 head subdomain-containing protein n=1 Tax=Umezawaea sp. NPDC059074 TaxID=3346716 RepID=UPI0036818A60
MEPRKATTPERRQQIADEKKIRQSPELLGLDDQTYQQFLLYYQCPPIDLLTGEDDPALPLVTCDADNPLKYVLGPAFLDNTHVISAEAGSDPQGVGYVVTLTFDSWGSKVWADFTAANVQRQAALVFNTLVISAPNINEPITGGSVQISGTFDRAEAEHLADQIAGR